MMTKRRRFEELSDNEQEENPITPNWSELQPGLLEKILSKLPVPFLAFRCLVKVCSSWRAALKVPSLFPILIVRPPIFDFQNLQTLTFEKGFKNPSIHAFQQNKNIRKWLDNGFWVGFSHEWMVVLDKNVDPLLLNPFTGYEISLPRREVFPDFSDLCLRYGWEFDDPRILRKFQCNMIIKAVLSGNPYFEQDYKLIIIYGFKSKLAIYRNGDQGWRVFGDSSPYCDVVCYDNQIFALCKDFRTEVWFLDNVTCAPIQIIKGVEIKKFNFSGPENTIGQWELISRTYLVPSAQEIFYIKRHLQSARRVYRTVGFQVYKMYLTGERNLVEINSLGNNVVFLGGNETKMIPAGEYEGCEANCIYFLDDSRNRWTDELYPYLGYDVGVYRLQNHRVDLIRDRTYEPMPYWILPRLVHA